MTGYASVRWRFCPEITLSYRYNPIPLFKKDEAFSNDSMPDKPRPTQRAYTLRLRGEDSSDESWRTALWQTHKAVNKGAQAFGDWLLTLRGGLDHKISDATEEKAKKQQRILLALSWLSVESREGAPEEFTVIYNEKDAEDRVEKLLAALSEILQKRGMEKKEIASWQEDCKASLSASIRDDAVWVNRSAAFDRAFRSRDMSTRKEAWEDMLLRFFKNSQAYLKPLDISKDEEGSGGSAEEKAKELVQDAGSWLSQRFGTGEGADFERLAKGYQEISDWAAKRNSGNMGGEQVLESLEAALSDKPDAKGVLLNRVLKLVSGPGHKSATRNLLREIADKESVLSEDYRGLSEKAAEDAEKCRKQADDKGQRAYSDGILGDVEKACGFTYRTAKNGKPVPVADYGKHEDWGTSRHQQFSVMLDHAARRVSLAHTWIKRAEAERESFEKDAEKLKDIPRAAREWLDEYCAVRSQSSGAQGEYRIRRRAVDAPGQGGGSWSKVVAAWGTKACKSQEDRVNRARELQKETQDKNEKFGDIRLFEDLAVESARCVWEKDGKPDHQLLIDYALAKEAEFNKRRFKVPAYRHPHMLLHPVFCDFGNSRWDIAFAIHNERRKNNKSKGKKQVESDTNPRALSMQLWTGSEMKDVQMCWQSKQLTGDLALEQGDDQDSTEVARADRLGRAAAGGMGTEDKVNLDSLFAQKDWNGRLQAPRHQLEALERAAGAKSKKLKSHIHWLVTFSAKLQPQGPWCEYALKHDLSVNSQAWPHSELNKSRKGKARLILSRLPGLRLLAVDLGHRHAAACAVWETLSAEQVREACREAGHREPAEADLFLHLKRKEKKTKGGREIQVEKTTIYRRIGPDTLPGDASKPYPAPWARLERQFLVKLQGEETEVRQASNSEIWLVHQLEADMGRTTPIIDQLNRAGWGQKSRRQKERLNELAHLGWEPAQTNRSEAEEEEAEAHNRPSLSVDYLMSSAVRTLRNALRRHGDRARIAFAMTGNYKPMPGDRKYFFHQAKDASADDDPEARKEKHIEFIVDALKLWYGLVPENEDEWRGWRDEWADNEWKNRLTKLNGYKRSKEEDAPVFRDIASALIEDKPLREHFHDIWKKRWKKEDNDLQRHLRTVRDWLLPRGKTADASIRNVGGLSLNRLATITEFRRKVQVGFFTRLYPEGCKKETDEGFGQSTLDALDHLREQRVKQLASRLVEAALGIGRMKPRSGNGSTKRPQERRDPACQAIIIENLTNYRPEETRTRRENRQLMTWSSSRVKKYLSEACELHGLHLREVSAGYTSRQDSRTGAAGVRCQDVPVKGFMRQSFWQKKVERAQGNGAEEEFLRDLNAKWKDREGEWQDAGYLRIPHPGGDIFVSAEWKSPAARGLQADLNAAANIGLRAITDPDWPGAWWYVPCDANHKPRPDQTKGSEAFSDPNQPLLPAAQSDAENKAGRKGSKARKPKEHVNLWRDISATGLAPGDDWRHYAHYQNLIRGRVIRTLRNFNGIKR